MSFAQTHFYQTGNENPWVSSVELQKDANEAQTFEHLFRPLTRLVFVAETYLYWQLMKFLDPYFSIKVAFEA